MKSETRNHIRAHVAIIGGGLGGCAAALALAEMGLTSVLVEETDWIGGQLTSQMVPPDENHFIEQAGGTARYRSLRDGIRKYYKENYPLCPGSKSDPFLNPGGGTVSRLCFEPRVGVSVLYQMLSPWLLNRSVQIVLNTRPLHADVQGDKIRRVHLLNLSNGGETTVEAQYYLDASDLGDLLPMTGAEYGTGAESRLETGEPHAPDQADPEDVQAFTWCFPVAYDPACKDDRHLINRPVAYDFWKNHIPERTPRWPGPLLSWRQCSAFDPSRIIEPTLFVEPGQQKISRWLFRRIVDRRHYPDGLNVDDVTLVNWPQNDYTRGNLIDKPAEEVARCLREARELSLSLLFWLQTEAPRPDGNRGYPGLYLRPDISGTEDGLAKAPYIREGRRMKGLFTVTENHILRELREDGRAERFHDSVGIGHYRMDLHPSASGRNYLDLPACPFQIPLGSLVHRRVANLLAAGKSLSVTHLANACYRLHPVEWNVGEAAGILAAFCIEHRVEPSAVSCSRPLLTGYQEKLVAQGIAIEWPRDLVWPEEQA